MRNSYPELQFASTITTPKVSQYYTLAVKGDDMFVGGILVGGLSAYLVKTIRYMNDTNSNF
jgi:hypothetical protein